MLSQLSYPPAPVIIAYGGPAVKGFMPFPPWRRAETGRAAFFYVIRENGGLCAAYSTLFLMGLNLGGGRFDLTVGPLVRLWGIGTDDARVPAAGEIAAALALVDWRTVAVSDADSTVFLGRPGAAIDLGAIAKGYAADAAVAVLAANGVTTALVDLGGNIVTLGAKPDGSPWRIGLQDPDPSVPRGTHIGIVEFEGSRSVVTSGTYERYLVRDGVRYHHLLDTATGRPVANGLTAVTIFATRSIVADGWSTLVFAAGLERGRALVESAGGEVEAAFFTDGFEVYATPGLRGRLKLSDARWQLRGW